jgi:multisubunit Na+/H+ antiporter MnhC subunit
MIGQKLFEELGESANPVFIKEMRQYFQNRRMIILMGLLLLIEFICTLFFSSAAEYSADGGNGVAFFLLVVFGGAILSVIICSLGAEQRFAEERSDKELNYAMLTTLKPASIILGKLEGALVMILCIFSLLLPFLTASYFLRGLSAASLLLVLFMIPVLVLATLAGILAGSFGKRWITILYFIALINAGISIVPFGFGIAQELIDGAALDPEIWIALGVEYGISLLIGGLLFLLSVAVVSPPKSNRLFAVKLYLFLLPFFTCAVMTPFYLAFRSSGSFTKEIFYAVEFLFAGGAFGTLLLISLFEQPTAGIRVYMKCPRNFFGRIFHFIFSTGFCGSLLLAVPVMVIPLVILPFMKFRRPGEIGAYGFLCMMFTVLSAVLLSQILSWMTKLRLLPWLWTVIFLVVGNAGVLVPVIINEGYEDLHESVQIIAMQFSQIFTFIEFVDGSTTHSPIPTALVVSAIVTGVLFLVLSPVYFKAFRLHRRPDDSDAVKTPTAEMMKK